MIIVTKCLIIGIGLYVLVGVAIYVNQYKLLYVPHTYPLEEALSRAKENQFQLWPTQDANYLGLLSDIESAQCKGTVLFFHGNAGSAMSRTYYTATLNAMGYRVVLLEYPGYGAKAGPLGEPSLVAAGCLAVQKAHTQFNGPLYVMAESLGCGVACAVTRDTQSLIQGLLLIAPWDTLPNLAQQRYSAFPTRYLSKDKYNNIANIQSFDRPVGVVIADLDEVIPTVRAENLVSSLSHPPKVWRLMQVGHNNWFDAVTPAWWQEVMTFLTSTDQPSDDML